MKILKTLMLAVAALALASAPAEAQERSGSTGVSRGGASRRNADNAQQAPGVTQRMLSAMKTQDVSDADLDYERVLYRELDLTKTVNAPLYYPDEVVDGRKNLFRIIMDLVAAGNLTVYEYLDGREVFTDQYKVNVRDMLDRFHILHTDAKGSTEKRPKFDIDESDVPANEVLTYYVIERWQFDRRTNKLRCNIEAICPVLHRSGDFGGEAVRYPMFWVKYDDLRPNLTTQTIFLTDDNNHASHTLADYFAMNLYEGDIYKTRNLRNLSLAQIHSDPDQLRHAQDSIQRSLETYTDKMWVPSLEQLEAMRIARAEAQERAENSAAEVAAADTADTEAIGEGDAVATKKVNARVAGKSSAKKSAAKKTPKKKSAKVQKPKTSSPSSSPSNAARSVRNRKK